MLRQLPRHQHTLSTKVRIAISSFLSLFLTLLVSDAEPVSAALAHSGFTRRPSLDLQSFKLDFGGANVQRDELSALVNDSHFSMDERMQRNG